MSVKIRKDRTPTLSFKRQYGCFELMLGARDSLVGDDTYSMLINVGWDGNDWYNYKFIIQSNIGEWFEIVTNQQFKDRVQDIEDNEGEKAAEIWACEQDQVSVALNEHPVFRLQKHFEAMMELDLFDLSVTHHVTWSKPLDKEVAQKMTTAYHDQMGTFDPEAIAASEREAESLG